MYFDLIHSQYLHPPLRTHQPIFLRTSFLFLTIINSSLSRISAYHIYMNIGPSNGAQSTNSPGATKKSESHSPSSHSPAVPPQLGAWLWGSLFNAGNLTGLMLCMSYAGSFGCSELMCIRAMSCPEDRLSEFTLPPSSLIFFMPTLWNVLWAWAGERLV